MELSNTGIRIGMVAPGESEKDHEIRFGKLSYQSPFSRVDWMEAI